MSKAIILQGPSPSGKTTMAAAWVTEDPQHRRSAGNFAQASAYLRQGFDVILDIDGFSQHDIQVFGPEQIRAYLGQQLNDELKKDDEGDGAWAQVTPISVGSTVQTSACADKGCAHEVTEILGDQVHLEGLGWFPASVLMVHN